jgi:ABC-type sugar transport systems, permease components
MIGERTSAKIASIAILLAPSLACLTLFYAAPMIVSLGVSLTDSDMIISRRFVGLANFSAVFSEPRSLLALRNMLLYLVTYLPSVLLISLILALAVDSPSIRRPGPFRAILFIPVIASWVTVSLVWKWIFGGRTGLINILLGLVGIHGPTWLQDPNYAFFAVLVPTVWKDVGLATTILLAGLDGINGEYYEAAEIEGASAAKRAMRITLPLLSPTIFFLGIMLVIYAFQLFDQVLIMTDGGPIGATSTIVEQIYKNAFKSSRMAFASAQSWVLFAIVMGVTLVQNAMQKKWVFYDA